MGKPKFNTKPTFLRQGLLIVLPVVVLVVVGLFSLRQDKILARHEATERAQAIANDLLPKIWNELTSTNNPGWFRHLPFQTDSAGHLLFPPPFAPVPHPLNSTELPPDNSQALAQYDRAVLLARQGKFQEAADAFEAVVENFPDAIGDSGLELGPLARWKLLELQTLTTNHIAVKHFIIPGSFWPDAVLHPTPLTPFFLQRASEFDSAVREIWKPLWEEHELSRTLYAATRHRLGVESASGEPLLTVQAQASKFPFATERPIDILASRFFWFETQESWDRGLTPVVGTNRFEFKTGERNWLAVRYDDIPPEANEAKRPATREAWSLLKRRIEEGKAGTTRAVTLDNQEAILSKNRAKPIFKESKGRNVPFLKVVEGPAGSPSDNGPTIPTNFWFVCRAESEIGSQITALVDAQQVPDYFGVGIVLAGKKLTWNAPDLRVWHDSYYMSKGAGQVKKEYSSELASTILASATKLEQGTEQLMINLYLTSPTELFKRQRTRTFWFGSLIGVSALAALIGLIAAWGAFNRQQQLSELKANFVSSVSHELRAPIASVRLMAESLERGKIPDAQKQSEYFRFMVQECRRLTSLIENVLDFSRIEQGRKQYEFEPTDLVALTRETVKLMETYAEEHAIKLETTIDPQLATLNAQPSVDGKAIQQALVNLIDNAIKHSPKGGTVAVGLVVESQGREVEGQSSTDVELLDRGGGRGGGDASQITNHESRIALSVTNHGEGIPPEEHEKIFERFYRRGSELRRETQGVGIGLSIVKHIVEAHGGRVLVRSAIGQGSRFTIEIPVKRN